MAKVTITIIDTEGIGDSIVHARIDSDPPYPEDDVTLDDPRLSAAQLVGASAMEWMSQFRFKVGDA